MTSSVRILTTSTIDSDPSILLVSPDGSKTLINCGEGCQRAFLESSSACSASNGGGGGLRVKSVTRVCLTHLGYDSIGGLPGTILTSADASALSVANSAAAAAAEARSEGAKIAASSPDGGKNGRRRKNFCPARGAGGGDDGEEQDLLPGLDVVGPTGTETFVRSLRHFMRRERFRVRVREGRQEGGAASVGGATGKKGTKKKKKKKKGDDDDNEEFFTVRSTPIPYDFDWGPRRRSGGAARRPSRVANGDDDRDGGGGDDPPIRGDENAAGGNPTDRERATDDGPPAAKRPRPPRPPDDDDGRGGGAPPPSRGSSRSDDPPPPHPPLQSEAVSYVFQTPPIPGKFLVDKAKSMGLKPGPSYARLKSGRDVTFVDPLSGEEKTVKSEDVVEGGAPGGAAIAVIYCPTMEVWEGIRSWGALTELRGDARANREDEDGDSAAENNGSKKKNSERPILDLMIHLTPRNVFREESYQRWMGSFGPKVDHVALRSKGNAASAGWRRDDDGDEEDEDDGTPFRSAAMGAATRSLLHGGIFPSPFPLDVPDDDGGGQSREASLRDETKCGRADGVEGGAGAGAEERDDARRRTPDDGSFFSPKVFRGRPLMEYVILPRSKKGPNRSTVRPPRHRPDGISAEERRSIRKVVEESGAADLARETIESFDPERGERVDDGDDPSTLRRNSNPERGGRGGELIFTGTGSAVPCKHRNVTGMYLRAHNGNAMLLDVGEGTTGQLLRAKKGRCTSTKFAELIRGIKAVWVSHPHADHHLGILRLLAERNAICGFGFDPVVLMAPPSLFRFLSEYETIDPRMRGSYVPLNCWDMTPDRRNPLGTKLYDDLGITRCVSIPVAHCPHSYAIVIDGTPFGRLAYSGDCRPSSRFASFGRDADLLIHESTFEDGMEEEATLKRHCTVGEALEVGRKMKAKAVVLTHFSQRYPKIPPLSSGGRGDGGDVADVADADASKEEGPSTVVAPAEASDADGGGSDRGRRSSSSTGGHDVPVVFAFDFMTLMPDDVSLASKLTPALRRLYPDKEPDDEDDGGSDEDDGTNSRTDRPSSAKEMLSVPGVFAASGIL